MLPKTNEPDHIDWVVSRIRALAPPEKQRGGASPIRIIGMIESAIAMVRIEEIAQAGRGHLDSLLVSCERQARAEGSRRDLCSEDSLTLPVCGRGLWVT